MARVALAAELRDLLAWNSALPAGDWRVWVADSHAVRDRAAFLVVRTLFCTFMNTVLLGYLLQTFLLCVPALRSAQLARRATQPAHMHAELGCAR
jgi:hypothetical protein